MLKKRIIPCLDIEAGRVVKGTNFVNIKDAGDPVELAIRYEEEGADELVLLDIKASVDKKENAYELVSRIARHIRIPFTIGGGIREIGHVQKLLEHGADKVAVNSYAVEDPSFITDLAEVIGAQAVVVAVDVKEMEQGYGVYTYGAREKKTLDAFEWINEAVDRGAGELLITCIDSDGTKNGFNIPFYSQLADRVPIIASGGAGKVEDFIDVFEKTKVTGGLAASIFHYQEVNIGDLKTQLIDHGISIRKTIV